MSYVNILELIYPTDSIYISADSTSPADIVGGTWVQMLNKCIRAANDITSGGADEITLTVSQVPAHSHIMDLPQDANQGSVKGSGYFTSAGGNNNWRTTIPVSNWCRSVGGVVRTATFPHTRIYIFGDAQPKRGWF